jgi:predicted transcriptional regulator/GTPase SAR1 family protein
MIYSVDSNNLFGRLDILEALKKKVNNFKEGYRQNIALIGHEQSGKTSLIKQFLSDFKDEQIILVYLEIRTDEFRYFAHKFFGGLLYNFLKSRNLSPRDDLDYLIGISKPLIPRTVEEIKKIKSDVDNERLTEAYRSLLNLPEIFISETGKFCLIIIDEFQKLGEMKISNPFAELGKKIVSQRNCMFIFSSSQEIRARQILSEDLSLLFGNFEIINLGRFDVKTSSDFIDQVLGNIKIKPEYKSFLVNFTGGEPLYLKLFSEEAASLVRQEFTEELTLPILVRCLQLTLFDDWGILNKHYSYCVEKLISGKANRIYITILLAIANGNRKIKEIMASAHKNKNEISQKINRLIELNLVARNVNSYYIPDKIFNFWLRFVYQMKLDTVCQDEIEFKAAFRKRTEDLIRDFTQIYEKDTLDRIVELFNLFGAETLQLNGHRYKFSNFRDVKPINFADKENNLSQGAVASSRDMLWFILLKEERFVEEDVLMFLSECKKRKTAPQRRIIISLGETDPNAKLMALKEKIWVWSLADLNTVLNLYNRPFITK